MGPCPCARTVDQLSWPLALGCEVPWGRPDVLGYLGYCPRSRVVHQLSRATRARFRGPTGSTRTPGQLALGSEGPRFSPVPPGDSGLGRVLAGPPDLLGDSRSRPRACGVDQHSLVIRAPFRGPAGLTRSPGRSGLGPMACRVNQRSRRTRSWLQWLAGSTTYLVGAGAVFQCLRCPTALPGVSGPCLRPAISTNCTGQLALMSEGPWCRPAFPGYSDSGPMARRVDKLSQVNRALGPGPTVSTICPGRLRPGSEVLRGRPAVPEDSRLAPIARGVDQLSRVIQASV